MNRKLATLTVLASAAVAIAAAPAAHAADKAYLRVDSIPGEAQAADMKNAIDVKSYGFSAETPITLGATGTVTAGRPIFHELTITKSVDAATPTLFMRMVQAQQIPAVELVVAKTDQTGSGPAYNRYCFQNVNVVSQKQEGASGDEGAQETIEFAFGAVSQMYTRQNATGPAANVFSGWNGAMGKPVSPAIYPAGCPVKGI